MITNLIIGLFLLGTIVYFSILLFVIRGLLGIEQKPPRKDEFVTVVVSFRNEVLNISNLLQSLKELTYPIDLFEVIFINDGSTDGGEKLVEAEMDKQLHWDLIVISNKPKHLQGKKYGLTKAIEKSKGDVILTTDADCEVPPNWIQTMLGHLSPEVGMVLGHSPIHEDGTFFHRLLAFDVMAGSAVTAAGAFYDKPPHSNGRNLMYRKQAFFDVNGYSESGYLDSGDDFFLSQAVRKKTGWKFDFSPSPEAYVFTKAYSLEKKFLNQQLRKNSKAVYHTIPFLLAAFGILLHIIGLPFFVFSGVMGISSILALFVIKISLEFWAVVVASEKLHLLHMRKYYPIMAVLYPMFILIFSLAGSFKSYQWK